MSTATRSNTCLNLLSHGANALSSIESTSNMTRALKASSRSLTWYYHHHLSLSLSMCVCVCSGTYISLSFCVHHRFFLFSKFGSSSDHICICIYHGFRIVVSLSEVILFCVYYFFSGSVLCFHCCLVLSSDIGDVCLVCNCFLKEGQQTMKLGYSTFFFLNRLLRFEERSL